MFIELRSNFVPGIEFDEARTEVWVEGSRQPVLDEMVPMGWRDPVEVGMRIAEGPEIPPGRYTVIVTLRRASSVLAQRTVIVQHEGGAAVTVLVTRDCESVVCDDGLTCFRGICVPPDCLNGSGFDGCPTIECVASSDCDEPPIDCTDAVCLEGQCYPFPNHDECGTEEWCKPEDGCLIRPELELDAGPPRDGGGDDAGPPVGDAGAPGPDAGPPCRAGGCNDGNPCTDDVCEATGCTFTPNADPCDDGVFCNGPDTCGGGACSVHPGDPCPGVSVCDEVGDACLGCGSDADCPPDTPGPWSTCDFGGNACAASGDRTRSITSFTCVGGTCETSTRTQRGSCSRASRDGVSCGSQSCPGWGACGGFAGPCDDTGTQSRTCTSPICGGGTCNDVPVPQTQGCSRGSRDGVMCQALSCPGWGACGGFSGECGEDGTQSRTCTQGSCGGGSCVVSDVPQSRACTRSTAGASCGAGASCDAFGPCDYTDVCDRDAEQTRTCHDWRCRGGTCNDSPSTDTQACSRGTAGRRCGTNPLYCGTRTVCHVCQAGTCVLNTPHYDASCNPSCGEAGALCGSPATCCSAGSSCSQVGTGPPYADCAACCASSTCF